MVVRLTVDHAVAELARGHLVVELVLGRAEVAQVLGRPRPFCDVDVLLFASATLHDKPPPLRRHSGLDRCSTHKHASDKSTWLTLEEMVAVSLQ